LPVAGIYAVQTNHAIAHPTKLMQEKQKPCTNDSEKTWISLQ